jgi:hypothetical protein
VIFGFLTFYEVVKIVVLDKNFENDVSGFATGCFGDAHLLEV